MVCGGEGALPTPCYPRSDRSTEKGVDLGGARRQHQDMMDAAENLLLDFTWLGVCGRGDMSRDWVGRIAVALL